MGVELIKIGRSIENDVVLTDDSISRYHAELFRDEEGNIFLTDLDSTNGTYVNGERLLESVLLKPNDLVQLGSCDPLPWMDYFQVVEEAGYPANEPIVMQVASSRSNIWIPIAAIGTAVFLIAAAAFWYLNTDQPDNHVISDKGDDEVIIQSEDESRNKKKEPEANIPKPTNREITYSYDCMDTDFLNDMNDFEKEMISTLQDDVTLKEEKDVGKQLYEGCKAEYEFVYDERYDKISSILGKIKKAIPNPRGFNYSIYLLESNEINAFTAGGYVFVTTAMCDFVKNDDELACVIGHELAHNECKHINHQLKKQKVSENYLGELFGSAAEVLTYVLTMPFNQKNETESDFHGIDYAVNAGYNSCEVIDLWKRMSELDGEEDEFSEMLRSHPYSSKRSVCCKNHIETNYKFDCSKQ